MAEDQDIVELLLEDHEEFRSVFQDLEQAPTDQREDLFTYLVAKLAAHEASEEALVHRALRDEVPGGDEVAEAVLAEESEAESLLHDIADVDVTSNEFGTHLARLRKDVLAHAEHEERDEFPKLREHLDADRRRELGRRFQKVKDAGPTRPHPNTPQTPEVRAALGPLVGAFDRARDKARQALES